MYKSLGHIIYSEARGKIWYCTYWLFQPSNLSERSKTLFENTKAHDVYNE